MKIEYVLYKNIDKTKWDYCINNAVNGLIYALSLYLDNTAENWDGLILNDYEAVMPLTWKKKWGIKYLYQPTFMQQGGIFFCSPLSDDTFKKFLHLVRKKFVFAEIALNYANTQHDLPAECKEGYRNNYIVDLNHSYDELFQHYHPHFTKSLRRIKKFNLKYTYSTDVGKAVELYKSLYFKRLASVTEKDFEGLQNICMQLSLNGCIEIRNVYSQTDMLLATVLFLRDQHRLYNIISCITEEGKKAEANYFLYDNVIREFCNSNILLDMEGSDKKGISDFYKKLNPINQQYKTIRYNDLPPLLKIFKS